MTLLDKIKKRSRALLVGTGILLIVVVALVLLIHKGNGLTYLTAKVTRGDVRDVVEATGTVNAVISVQVGSQVSGTIAKLNADFNSRVHKGEVIALIDPSLFEGALKQAKADLANAAANVVGARANLEKAKVNLVQMKAEYGREETLRAQGVVSQQVLDLAKANFESARASVQAASANVIQAKAQEGQKRAAVSVAKTTLDHTVIRSPIDGTVVARNVDVGQTVAASLQAPTIFTIAQDLTKMYVYAKVDESDVGRIRIRQPVTFKVDAFPKDVYEGRISQVRMDPTMIQNVVTYDAVIEFDNPEMKLFPGMTAYVTIPVATATDVVKVSNAALRYKPPMAPDVVRAQYAKYGIHDLEKGAAPALESFPAPAGRSQVAPHRAERAVVWKLAGDASPVPVELALGITDDTYTQVLQVLVGHLKPGDDVVVSSISANALPPGARGFGR